MSRDTHAASARPFGRRAQAFVLGGQPHAPSERADDARLFALTFAGGFLFMSVFLA